MGPAIEALRGSYEAMSRGDWSGIFRDVQPNFELRTPDENPQARTYHGRAEAERAFADFFEPYEEVVAEPQEAFENGDQIVVFFVLRSRPRGGSAMVEIRAAHLWTMRDGKPASLEIFPKREHALAAAGISS
jgi:ketosteroid isomerase-like protein